MTSTLENHIDTFRTTFNGTVLTIGEPEYDTARSVWNGEIDRKPAVIAQCINASDVAAAIAFGRDQGLPISVRGGGHAFSGTAVCEAGVMIDLSRMNTITVDPETRRARCGGGSTWAQLDAATQQHNLATPGGTISHTGVGGLTLGGGFGWLTGRAGLSCDNLVSAELVTADGRIVQASATEHPDLFWAIRGGGGNFGVATTLEFRLHDVGPFVHLGLFFWPLEQGAEALRIARQAVADLPPSTGVLIASLNAPPAPFVPEEHQFRPGYALMVSGFGTAEEHARLIDPIRAALPPLFELVTPLPYVALQQMLDEAAPWGILAYEKAHYLNDISDAAIDVITDHMPKKNSPMSIVPIFPMRGAFHSVPDDATAFGGGRAMKYVFNIGALAPTQELLDADRAWVRGFWEGLRPHAAGAGTYVNFMAEYEDDRVRAAYGPAKYTRLAAIKRTYDPDNIFRGGANIKPA